MQQEGDNITITLNKLAIRYNDQGKNDTPIIFIHGFPFDKSAWQPQMDALKTKYRVISYDLRGFGDSMPGDDPFKIMLFADDLIGFMDALEINKAIVCGLSMGGYILLNAVHRYPERFEAIILADTQAVPDSAEAREKRHQSIKQIENAGVADFATGFVNSAFCKETLDFKPEVVQKIKKIIVSTDAATLTKTLHALAERQDMTDKLNQITVPALIIRGKEDAIIPAEQAEFLKEHIKGATLHTIEHAGHLSNLEQPGEFNKHLNNFISNLG